MNTTAPLNLSGDKSDADGHWVTINGRHVLVGGGRDWSRVDALHTAIASHGPARAEQAIKDRGAKLDPHESQFLQEYAKHETKGHFINIELSKKIRARIDAGETSPVKQDAPKASPTSKPSAGKPVNWGNIPQMMLTISSVGPGRAAQAFKDRSVKLEPHEAAFVDEYAKRATKGRPYDPIKIAAAKKAVEQMNLSASLNLDRGTQGDEGHFVTIDHHVVFIKDDTGSGANGRGGKFTKHGLEKKLIAHHESRGGFAVHEHRGAMAEDSGGDLMGRSRFTFHKSLPGEVRKHIENNPAARKLFRVTSDAKDAKGADALASMGDKYFQMADEAAGGHMTQAIESASKSDDPEARFHAAMYKELPKTKAQQGLISPDKLREGHNFTVNGRAIHVVNDNGTLTLDGGSDWPSTPVQAMSEIPIDKHSLKMGKKAMSVEKEVIPFSRTIELSQGALFDKTDKSKGASGGQGHLYGGKSTKDRDGHDGHWVTIHGAKVFIKHGQSVGSALREHFGDSKPVTHEHVSHAAKQIESQGGKANVEAKDRPTEAKDVKAAAVEKATQVVDPNRQLGMFAKNKDGSPMEVGEKPGQAALFHDTAKAKPVVDKAQAKRDEDARATTEMFPATKPETVSGNTGKIGRDEVLHQQTQKADPYAGHISGVKVDKVHSFTADGVTHELFKATDGTGRGVRRSMDDDAGVAISTTVHPTFEHAKAAHDEVVRKSDAMSKPSKPTARDTIDATTPTDEPADSPDFTRTEARDIKADAVKRAKNAAFKPVGDSQKAALLDKGREFTYGDVFKSPDGKMGYLKQGDSPSRVKLVGRAIGTKEETLIGHYDRAELTPHMRVYSDTERKEQMNTPEARAASVQLRKDAAAKAGTMEADHAKQAAEQDAWAKIQASAGEAAKKMPLKDALSSIVDESGNITRGGDFIRELASGRTDKEVKAAHEWSQKHASAPVRRVIGDVLAGEIRSRASTPTPPLPQAGNADKGSVSRGKAGKSPAATFSPGDAHSVHPNLIEYTTRELFKGKDVATASKAVAKKFDGQSNMFLGGKVSVSPAELEHAVYAAKAANLLDDVAGRSGQEKGYVDFYAGRFNLDPAKLAKYVNHAAGGKFAVNMSRGTISEDAKSVLLRCVAKVQSRLSSASTLQRSA